MSLGTTGSTSTPPGAALLDVVDVVVVLIVDGVGDSRHWILTPRRHCLQICKLEGKKLVSRKVGKTSMSFFDN